MRVTWWGHSTITVEAAGSRLLTDPVLTNRVGHLRRRRGPRPPVEAGRADAVLVSHLHADHLHLTSLPLVDPAARIVVPKGAAALVARECGAAIGDRCVEVEPGTRVRVGEVTVTAVPARHDDRRGPWSSEVARPVGYRIDGPALSAWFAGDTDLYDEMAREIGQVDLALVPVGGWGPTLGPGHLDPVRAVDAVRRLGARHAVPVHFGTFWPIGLDWVRPERFLPPGEVFRDLLADDQVRVDVLAPGESAEVVPDER
jgi:L-ascorbate metabolism protein UlaG (beta-lactamase superfamily)